MIRSQPANVGMHRSAWLLAALALPGSGVQVALVDEVSSACLDSLLDAVGGMTVVQSSGHATLTDTRAGQLGPAAGVAGFHGRRRTAQAPRPLTRQTVGQDGLAAVARLGVLPDRGSFLKQWRP